MTKADAIQEQLNRIAILTKRMERVTNIAKSNNDSAKATQAAFIIVQIVMQAAQCKVQLMIISSQLELPKDFKQGGIITGAYSEQYGGEFIIPKQSSG
jgi:hypothetical protein